MPEINPNEIEQGEGAISQDISPEFDKLSALVQRLNALNERVNQHDAPRINFGIILENEKLLAIYHKEFGHISKQARFIKMFRQEFMKDVKSNPELATSRIKTHFAELTQLMQMFDPKDIARLNRALLMANKSEIDELNKCIADIRAWPKYRLTNRIEFFSKRLMLYVKGGKDETNGVEYIGLGTVFKDVELVKQMFSVSEIKKLWTYRQEMQFFTWARANIMKSIQEPGWEGFYRFYKNLRKGQNYIKVVRNTFGNEEFASYLERLPERIHENIQAWIEELGILSDKLHNFTYQNQNVIQPAVDALLRLFQSAIDRIASSRLQAKELDDILEALEKSIERKLEEAKGRVEAMKREFNRIDDRIADETAVVMPALFDMMNRVGNAPDNRLRGIGKLAKIFGSWLDRFSIDARRFLAKPVVPIGRVFFEAAQTDRLAATEFRLLNMSLIDPNVEFVINALEQRISQRLEPLLKESVDFIRQNDGSFAVPVSSAEDLLPEVKQIVLQLQREIEEEFRKEGVDPSKPLFG
ncbi:hypothetical protein HY637_04125 [Candidatus Woesearchaeota archaeon]|nr:hypothetical protein [Candidatus Woesearchaeota archaeon]